MTGTERIFRFIAGRKVDRPPLHPIVMRFAARHAGVPYSDFCRIPEAKCRAMVQCAEDFGLDWVTVMSDPNAEAEAFGLEVTYPYDSLPVPAHGPLLHTFEDSRHLQVPDFDSCKRMTARVEEVARLRESVGGRYFIVGWVEGPMAAYSMLRGLTDACLDFYDHPNELDDLFDLFVANAKTFITRQVQAGADCIGVGDASASQIGPELYRRYIVRGEAELARHIRSLGAVAKLHICGNTAALQAMMIQAGYDIVDVDHGVGSMAPYRHVLGPQQVFSGMADPVADILNAPSYAHVAERVDACWLQSGGRTITSAGCEIPGETEPEKFAWFCEAGRTIFDRHSV